MQQSGRDGREVIVDGMVDTLAASVEVLEVRPAHADQGVLAGFFKGMRKQPEGMRIVQGDDCSGAAFQRLLPGAMVPRFCWLFLSPSDAVWVHRFVASGTGICPRGVSL